jgi:hypothetical protein
VNQPGKHTREMAAALILIAHANARREDAVRTMDEQVNGFGSAGETPGVSGGGHSDPTAALSEKRDDARNAKDRERSLRRQLVKAADEYARLVYGWAPAQQADARAQQETAEDNRRRCEPCAAEGFDADCFRRTDHGGILGYPMAQCGWHYKQVKKHGALPSAQQVIDHHHRRERVA